MPPILRRACLVVLFSLAFPPLNRAQSAPESRKVILDNDGGTGGCTAMLVAYPGVELLGCTVVSGDYWRDLGTAQTIRELELMGRADIPVVPGAIFPLLNSREATKRWEGLYGKLIYKGAWMEADDWGPTLFERPAYRGPFDPFTLPEGNPTTKPSPEIAANFMIRMVHKYPNQVTIIGDGPMTNIALAIKLDYEFASLAKEIVFMAGSFQPRALNDEFAKELTYTPRLEFNFQWDAEAARIMLHAPWKKITCVPNDATCVTLLDNALLKEASTSPTPWSDYLLHHVAPNYPLWDEASVAVWLDPTIIKKSSTLLMDVDASYGPGYGNTLSWPEGYGPGLGERTVTVVWEMDVPKLNQLYVNCMRAIK